jgi:hypothetical protein
MDHGFRIVPRSETAALQPYLSFRFFPVADLLSDDQVAGNPGQRGFRCMAEFEAFRIQFRKEP